ncbi:MAG: capsular biosynthesis protein, partial [Cyclobacteriaceae bacterium]|nr:capsular biosynthesis protein [Cyclobacteriaceae bacterium]
MFKLFKKQQPVDLSVLGTDVHSHLLPGIDDGARVFDDSLEMIRALIQLGYKKLITTPHIMQDYYPNTPEIILTKLEELKIVLKENDLNIEVEVAAEYYLDEFLMEKLDNTDQLLTFGKNYILFEMSFYNESPFIKDFIF